MSLLIRRQSISIVTRCAQRSIYTRPPTRDSLKALGDRLERIPRLPTLLLQRLQRNSALDAELTRSKLESIKNSLSSFANNFFRSHLKADKIVSVTVETLNVNEILVWDYMSPFLWHFSSDECQALYESCVMQSRHHCEIGYGTSIFLINLTADRPPLEKLFLVDRNAHILDACETQYSMASNMVATTTKTLVADISAYHPILDDLNGSCDSVGANFLLQCVEGDCLLDKRQVFLSCASLLNPSSEDSSFFGSTVLGKDLLDGADEAGEAAVKTIRDYNRLGIFRNEGDSYEDLSQVLHDVFDDVEVWRSGYCGVWRARRPKSAARTTR